MENEAKDLFEIDMEILTRVTISSGLYDMVHMIYRREHLILTTTYDKTMVHSYNVWLISYGPCNM